MLVPVITLDEAHTVGAAEISSLLLGKDVVEIRNLSLHETRPLLV